MGTIKAQDSAVISKVKELENKLPAIIESNDVDALEKILHPSFTVQAANGEVVKKEWLLKRFRNGKNPYLKFRPQASSVVIVDQNTVISSGTEMYAHKSNEDAVHEAKRFFYHVWIRQNDTWLLAGRIIAATP